MIDPPTAQHFSSVALGHVAREYPHKLDHVLESDADAQAPRVLHPAFFGSFDWHSCVHGWWTLLTLRRMFPDLPAAREIEALADATFTPAKLAVELAYLQRPSSRGFERPYGWAWMLALHREATQHSDKQWAAELRPIAEAVAERFRDYLHILTYPIRTGTHFNSAFALVLALDWTDAFAPDLGVAMRDAARRWYGRDRDCQAWEPGGDEFLSPALIEALCMAKTLPADQFRTWFGGFLPRVSQREPATLFTPAMVSDRSDGKVAHLDGVNLSRAWCWCSLARLLGEAEARLARETAKAHLAAALPHVSGDYMGEHWLASFALLTLLAA